MTETQMKALFEIIRAAYPSARVPPGAASVYEAVLHRYSFDEVRDALMRHIATSPWAPTPADLAKQCALAEINAPVPSVAWDTAVVASMNGGGKNLHPLVKKALQHIGGASALRYSENPATIRAQFLAAYREYLEAEVHSIVTSGGGEQ